jgi:hypothetical protein
VHFDDIAGVAGLVRTYAIDLTEVLAREPLEN